MELTKILLADDYGILRRALMAVIDSETCKVTEAKNGEEAINLIDSESFDLFILDVFMPEKNGIEVLRYIADKKNKASVIIITGGQVPFLSLKTPLEDEIKEIASNSNIKIKILYKPFKSAELLDLIDSMLKSDG